MLIFECQVAFAPSCIKRNKALREAMLVVSVQEFSFRMSVCKLILIREYTPLLSALPFTFLGRTSNISHRPLLEFFHIFHATNVNVRLTFMT
jgi:hypothetical protein